MISNCSAGPRHWEHLENLHLTMTVSHQTVCPLETIPALPGVALARPSQFSCFSLKLLFQKMAISALLEVHCNLLKLQKREVLMIELKCGAFNRLDTENILLSRVFHLLRAISYVLQDCAHGEPPGTRNTRQSRIPWGNVLRSIVQILKICLNLVKTALFLAAWAIYVPLCCVG